MIRSRSRVFELAMCNDWDCFVTLTLDEKKYDRFNLKAYIKDLSQFIRDERKKTGAEIKYLLVPELHKNGAWHLHGMMKGLPQENIFDNGNFDKNGQPYQHWKTYYDKFGFMSFSPIQSEVGSAIYMSKYISKTMIENNMDLHIHSYYATQGLKGADDLQSISKFNLIDFPYCYESDFVDVANLTLEQAMELLKINQDIEGEE